MSTETKTSAAWLTGHPRTVIMDYDGWDRSSQTAFDYSFNLELTTYNEFLARLRRSTITISSK